MEPPAAFAKKFLYAIDIVLVALVYVGAAQIGFVVAFVNGSISALWPPAGVALAALLLSRYRLWPGVALGALIANALTPVALWVAFGIAIGNTLEAVAGAYLLHRYAGFDTRLQRVRDAIALALCGAVSPLVSSLNGVALLCLGGHAAWGDFVDLWRVWWLGDALGVLTVAPIILTFAFCNTNGWKLSWSLEAVGWGTLMTLVALPIFFDWFSPAGTQLVWAYAIFPIIVAVAMRCGQRTTTVCLFGLAVIAIVGTARGYGPFAANTLNERLLDLQAYMAAMAMTGLLLAAAMAEQRRHQEEMRIHRAHLEELVAAKTVSLQRSLQALHHNQQLLEAVVDNSTAVTYVKDLHGRYLLINRRFEAVFQIGRKAAVGHTDYDLFPPAHADALREIDRRVIGLRMPIEQEELLAVADGLGTFISTKFALYDEAGEPYAVCGIATDISERKRSEERISHMAHHDALTGLPNRTLLWDRANQAIALAQRHRNYVALLFVDLDYFKHVNDSLGHELGDRLLQMAATRLQGCVRKGDSVARLGGDEFVLVLFEINDTGHVALVARKALEALDAPFMLSDHELHLGGSVGISLYPFDGTDVDTLMRAADIAMYHAKEKGRGNYQFFTRALSEAEHQRHTLDQQLRQALAKHEFVLYYQPQVDFSSGELCAVEALLRWRPPDKPMLACQEFIAIAEETGLILPLGKWALQEACKQLKQWRDAGYGQLDIAVNLSARQLYQSHFTGGVAQILEETGLPGSALHLEMTESVLMQPSEENLAILNALRGMGVHLSVDDFGTGYSSLSYLQRFPIDGIKIDRAFVRGIGENAQATAIVTAIIAMGHSLQLPVIAEGVETEQQASFLKAQGCCAAQGYYYGKPVPCATLTELLHQQKGGDQRACH